MDIDIRDEVAHATKPVLMAPKYSELPECPIGMVRFILAEQGLFLDTRMPFGSFRKLCWASPVPLTHCGAIEEVDDFTVLLNETLMPIVESEMIDQIEETAKRHQEWAGCIVIRDGQYLYRPVEHKASQFRLEGKYNRNTEGCLVLDVHSHGFLLAEFSETDDTDDDGGIKMSLVLGHYNPINRTFKMCGRVAAEGFFFGIAFNTKEISND